MTPKPINELIKELKGQMLAQKPNIKSKGRFLTVENGKFIGLSGKPVKDSQIQKYFEQYLPHYNSIITPGEFQGALDSFKKEPAGLQEMSEPKSPEPLPRNLEVPRPPAKAITGVSVYDKENPVETAKKIATRAKYYEKLFPNGSKDIGSKIEEMIGRPKIVHESAHDKYYNKLTKEQIWDRLVSAREMYEANPTDENTDRINSYLEHFTHDPDTNASIDISRNKWKHLLALDEAPQGVTNIKKDLEEEAIIEKFKEQDKEVMKHMAASWNLGLEKMKKEEPTKFMKGQEYSLAEPPKTEEQPVPAKPVEPALGDIENVVSKGLVIGLPFNRAHKDSSGGGLVRPRPKTLYNPEQSSFEPIPEPMQQARDNENIAVKVLNQLDLSEKIQETDKAIKSSHIPNSKDVSLHATLEKVVRDTQESPEEAIERVKLVGQPSAALALEVGQEEAQGSGFNVNVSMEPIDVSNVSVPETEGSTENISADPGSLENAIATVNNDEPKEGVPVRSVESGLGQKAAGKPAEYHKASVQLFFGSVTEPKWDLELEKSLNNYDFSYEERKQIMDDIFETSSYKLFIERKTDYLFQEFFEVVQLYMCLKRSLKHNTVPSVGVSLASIMSLTNRGSGSKRSVQVQPLGSEPQSKVSQGGNVSQSPSEPVNEPFVKTFNQFKSAGMPTGQYINKIPGQGRVGPGYQVYENQRVTPTINMRRGPLNIQVNRSAERIDSSFKIKINH